jgi:hypothetical protein
VRLACGTTEAVPFPVVRSRAAEGWDCGIPPFGFAQDRLLREVREGWGTLGSWWRRLISRFLTGLSIRFGMTRFYEACGATEVLPFPVVALPESSAGWGCGIPLFAKCAKDGPPWIRGGVGLQHVPFGFVHSRFLAGLSAQFGMTKCVKACGAA